MDNINHWLTYAILVMFFWGLWGSFSKLAAMTIRSVDVYVFQVVGLILGAAVIAILVRYQPPVRSIGIAYAILGGVLMTIGAYCFAQSIARGRGTVVVVVTALYPLVTLLFGYLFLHEMLSFKQIIGLGLALVAIVLLSG